MRLVARAHELGRDTDAAPGPLHAALEDISDAQRSCDLPHTEIPALEREAGGPRGDLQVRDLGEHVQQCLGQPIGEIFVV